jgi:hypothetical protein
MMEGEERGKDLDVCRYVCYIRERERNKRHFFKQLNDKETKKESAEKRVKGRGAELVFCWWVVFGVQTTVGFKPVSSFPQRVLPPLFDLSNQENIHTP